MMQALPPPPPYQCIKAVDASKSKIVTFITASGDPDQVTAWLSDVSKHPLWKVDADAENNGVRFVRLRASGDVPYKEIGGLIYYGQMRHLALTMNTEPPICEAEEE